MNTVLTNLIDSVRPADLDAMRRARERQAQLTKPTGSLGELEALSVRLAGASTRA